VEKYQNPPPKKLSKSDRANDSNLALIQKLRDHNKSLSEENRSFPKASREALFNQRENQVLRGRLENMEKEAIPSLLKRVKDLKNGKENLEEENKGLIEKLERYITKFGTLLDETSSQKGDGDRAGGSSKLRSVTEEIEEIEGSSHWSNEEAAIWEYHLNVRGSNVKLARQLEKREKQEGWTQSDDENFSTHRMFDRK
jgi:hypothetical protein